MSTDALQNAELDIFHYLNSSTDNFFFLANLETGHCRWSQSALEQFLLPQEMDGDFSFWRELVHPADYQYFSDACHDIQLRHTPQFCVELRFRLHCGGYAWVQCSGRMVGNMMLSGLVSRLKVKNNIDPVTNLRYIGGFRATLEELTQKPKPWGILLFGIDDFKRINDLYSYSFGDEVLADFAERLQKHLIGGALLFRLDGDNFGILYPHATIDEVTEHFNEVQTLAQQSVKLGNLFVSFSISGGICRYPDDGLDGETLYRNARIALVESKMRGKKQITVCTPALCTQAQRRMKLLEKLRESVQDDCKGFSLRFQPLINAQTEQLYGCEVLTRWNHPSFEAGVTPYEFIPILESSGLIYDVNRWLLREAFQQCAEWVRIMPSFQMNVNISCAQFEDPDFKFQVVRMIAEAGVPTSAITLELTESGEVSDMEAVNRIFSFLRSQGIKIALDDFGTGYSSLSIFQMLSADELKIDRSFLQRLTYNVTDQTLIRQIIELCHSMNMMVCVEGVENSEVTKIVRQFGPELLQGFYYGHPLTATEFAGRYFTEEQVVALSGTTPQNTPELVHSLTYSALTPAQPLSTEEVLNHAHAGIFQVAMDADFSFITCNEGYRRMLGYTAKEMEEKFGNHALGIVHPDDMKFVDEEVRRQLGEGDTLTSEFRVVRSDGTPIWVFGTGNVVKSPHGMASLIVIIVENSRIKNAQLEQQSIASRNECILKNIPAGIKCVRFDEDFTLEYISPAFLSLMGYDEADIATTFDNKYINLVYEEDRPCAISDLLEQLKASDIVTLRYRSPCKDGRLIWVETVTRVCPPDETGVRLCYSSVINVTDTITEEQKSRPLSIADRYQLASAQWGDVLFEYNFTTDSISYSDNYIKFFGHAPKKDLLAEWENVHPDDRQLLYQALQTVHQGRKPDILEVRALSPAQKYFWISVSFSEPEFIGGNPVSVLGRISDIDAKRKEQEKLLLQSRLDSATGLLNKGTIEQEIRARLTQNKLPHTMCVLDIDDFKGINDRHGHMFGDRVIALTAKRLKNLLGKDSLIGRSGGDEFVIYIPLEGALSNPDILGQQLVQTLCQPIEADNGESILVTSSIGISLFPRDGTDFYNLFRQADSALYLSKAQGQGGYCVVASQPVMMGQWASLC